MSENAGTEKGWKSWLGWVVVVILLGVIVVNYRTATRKGPVFERVSGAVAYLTQGQGGRRRVWERRREPTGGSRSRSGRKGRRSTGR